MKVMNDSVAGRVERELRAVLEERLEAENEALRRGELPKDSPLMRVTENFEAVQYASHYPGGAWRGDREAWIEGTRKAAAVVGEVFERWTMEVFRIAVRSEDEAVACYEVSLHPIDAGKAVGRAIFLETYVREGEGKLWMLRRHTAEKYSRR